MAARNFLWDPIEDSIIGEFDDDGNVLVDYTTEPDGTPISMHRDGHTYYFHSDGMGNIVALTDENGNVTDTFGYTAFGELVERTGSTVNPYQYKGEHGYYTDETGQCVAPRRVYSPESGRWLSPDPLGYSDGINRYEFVHNNPPTLIDPSGLAILTVDPTKPDSMPYYDKELAKEKSYGQVVPRAPMSCRLEKDCAGKYTFQLVFDVTLRIELDVKKIKAKGAAEGITLKGAYGHEQLHVKNFIDYFKKLKDEATKEELAAGAMSFEDARAACKALGDKYMKKIADWGKDEREHKHGPPEVGKPYNPIGTMPDAPVKDPPK